MAKTIFILTDGTWNSLVGRSDRDELSNVARMARALHSNDSQQIYYELGVGTGDRVNSIFGGMFGLGLYQNVQNAYQFIVENYQTGDKIALIGFSRGAYTARSLAGVIAEIGILRNKYSSATKDVFYAYKRLKRRRADPRFAERVERLSEHFCHENRDIEFMGVWDTVGSIGLPVRFLHKISDKFVGFLDNRLSDKVKNAFHALAIDEKRRPFKPVIWRFAKGYQPHLVGRRIEQRWFAGVHSNVGGGYRDCLLADLSFCWMVDKLASALPQTALNHHYIEQVRAQSLRPPAADDVKNSYTVFYRIFGRYRRQPKLGFDHPTHDTFEVLDPSVCRRFGLVPCYQPNNVDLNDHCTVDFKSSRVDSVSEGEKRAEKHKEERIEEC